MNKGFAIQFLNGGRVLITEFDETQKCSNQIVTISRKEFIEQMENLYLKYGVVEEREML